MIFAPCSTFDVISFNGHFENFILCTIQSNLPEENGQKRKDSDTSKRI